MRGIGGETKANLMASRTAKLGLPEGGAPAVLNDGFFGHRLEFKQKTAGLEPPFFFRLVGFSECHHIIFR